MKPEQKDGSSFIHSSLDEAGLTVQEFRVFCHISRRANGGECYASAESMAAICRIKRDTLFAAIRALESRGMLERESKIGCPTVYRITLEKHWHPSPQTGQVEAATRPPKRDRLGPVPNGDPSPQTGQEVSPQTGHPPVPPNGTVRYSPQGTPSKVLLVNKRDFAKKPNFRADELDHLIPIQFQTEEFIAAWHVWTEDRHARKKRVTEHSAKISLNRMEEKAKTPDIGVIWIANAIEKCWTGIYPVKSFEQPQPPTREEYFAFCAEMAVRTIPYPEEPRYQWPEERWRESYNRHNGFGWKGIQDWRSILKSDCQQWAAREQENRKRPGR